MHSPECTMCLQVTISQMKVAMARQGLHALTFLAEVSLLLSGALLALLRPSVSYW
jgi:hypothetical protein